MNVKRQEECLAAGLRYARYKFGLPHCIAKKDSRGETLTELLWHLKNEVKELEGCLYFHIENESYYSSDRYRHDMLKRICCECGDVINMASEIVDKIDGMVGENDA